MLSVLVIDDEPMVRRIIGRYLRNLGCVVTEAECAESGLRILDQKNEFGLAFVDANLPVMSGAQLTRRLVQRFPGLQVVLMSGDHCAPEASDAGAHGFLGKPFEFSELNTFVERAASIGETAPGLSAVQ
jgi:CheY-like chemotaxis protein